MADDFDPLLVTLLVTDVLESLGAPYLIGGSLASILHGMVRTTNDADLVSELRLDQVEKFAQALGDAFYVEQDSIRDAIRRRGCFNIIHLETMFKVDIYLSRRRAFDLARFQRRAREVLATDPERTAYVASAEDTLLAKLDWYRQGDEVSERQWRDVLGLIKTRGDQLDVPYLRRWAGELTVSDLLERALQAASAA